MIYILSEQRLKNDFNDVINLQSSTIQQATRTAQDIYLRSIIGDYLLETLEDMILNDTLTGDYKLLIDNYCIPYLEYRTMAELQMSTFKINNAGANQVYDSNVNTLSVEQVKYLEQQYINKASYYENRMTKYLIQSGIPEYKMKSGITNASTTITEQTGIFLGGTKTKTTKRTTNNKNSLVGAVRYDQEQNLSEQQKQQARENIGVTASGDINVDLDNYYTKDEVNELIDNVDVDLSEYYTKDEVYNKNQVDTKLTPYATTNEVNLILNTSYYDKQEVDEKIANVSSGGTIDLSNYYTKEETYSKEEVNNLVANSGGGGGSDTPSNTCMSIGDNYIVDLNTAYFTDIEVVAQKAKANPNNFVEQLITYKGKETERCKINSDNNVVFSHDNITIDGSGDKSFDVELVQGTRIFNTTQQKYPDIPNNEIWYKTNDGLPFEKIYVNAESRGTPFSHQYYDSELGLYRAVWSEAMENVPECFVIRDGYSGEELENTQVTHVYFNNYSKEVFNCFNNCVALVEVQLGTSSYCLNQTFRNCRSLREIFIPSNIINEYNESFRNCINLNTIILGGNYDIFGIPQNVGLNYKDLGVNRIYCTTSNEYIEEFAETNGFSIIQYSGTEVNIIEYQPIYTEKNNIIINQGGGGGGTTDLSNYYTKQEVDELIDNVDTSDVDLTNYYTKNEVDTLIENIDIPDVDLTDYYNKEQVDTLIAEIPTFSGNYNDLTNKPSVDIMTLPYSEQYDVLQYLVDNNVFPYTVTYKGVVLNNLPVEIDWWDEELDQRQIIFAVYGVQSYNIRFITYEWYDNVIYNDTHVREERDNLVKKGEVDDIINSLDIPTLPTLATVATSGDYNDLENKPTLFDGDYNSLSNTPTLSNVATSGNYSDLNNLPTLFDGDYNSLENLPTIPTATSQLTLDTVYSKSEIDLLFESVNTTLGDINNLLETI